MNNDTTKTQPFYRLRAEAADEPLSAVLLIYAAIGEWDDTGDHGAKEFAAELAKLPTSVKRLDIHINSPGGSVYEAQGIYSRLADHRSEKIVYIDGLAASAASLIAMVGQKIYIRSNANLMIHSPRALAMGDAGDMRHTASVLDTITESMINVYAKRTGLDRTELESMLEAETWMTAQEAVDKGFADEVRGVVKAAAMADPGHLVIDGINHDVSRFHNIPDFPKLPPAKKPPKKTRTKDQVTDDLTNAAVQAALDGTVTGDDDPSKDLDSDQIVQLANAATQAAVATAKAKAAEPEPQSALDAAFQEGVDAERTRVCALIKLHYPDTDALSLVAKAIQEGLEVQDILPDWLERISKVAGLGNIQAGRMRDAANLDRVRNVPTPIQGAEFGKLLSEKISNRLGNRAKSNGRLPKRAPGAPA
jgi:ATP-dependent protease ClpP protease subunit